MTARRKPQPAVTHMHILMASPTEPMCERRRVNALTPMWSGLASIMDGRTPNKHDWRACCDAINLVETLARRGHCSDDDGVLSIATQALANCAQRHQQSGQPFAWMPAALRRCARC